MSYDLDTRKRFLDLRARGRSFDRIAKELHVSKRTLITWSVEMQTELDILSALHLDALREELCAKKQQRMELLVRQIQRLRQELEGRDLSRIHETNLCHLLLRYTVALRKEDDSLDMSFTIPTDEVDMYLDHADYRVDTDPAPPAPQPATEAAAPAPTPDLPPAPFDPDPKPKVQSPMPVFSAPAVSDSSPLTPPDAASPSIPAPSSVPPASPDPAPKPKAQGVLLRPCSQRHCEDRSDEAIPSERPQALERDCFAALAMTPSLRISTEQVQGPTSVFAESSVNSVVSNACPPVPATPAVSGSSPLTPPGKIYPSIVPNPEPRTGNPEPPSETKTAPKLRQIRLDSLPQSKTNITTCVPGPSAPVSKATNPEPALYKCRWVRYGESPQPRY